MNRTQALATFRAMADPVRLEIVERIAAGSETTVTQLAAVMPITRQGISRHVRTLQDVGIVVGRRQGRQHRYRVETAPLDAAVGWLSTRTADWDRTLQRLADYLES